MKNLKRLAGMLFLVYCSTVFSQAPQLMSYQAVIRNASGNLVANAPVAIRISILQNSATGTAVYVETHIGTTNENGLVTIQIGGGNVQSGNFATIDWGNGTYFIKTETDPEGGSNYSISGTTQLLSVPYALYAENTKNPGHTTIYLTDDITDAEAAEKIAAQVGPNTENIYITNTTALTTVNIGVISEVSNIVITNNTGLQSVEMNTVKTVQESIIISGNTNLTAFSMDNLSVAKGVRNIDLGSSVPLTLPNVQKINCSPSFQIKAGSLNFPALTSVTAINNTVAVFSASTTLNLPVLTYLIGDSPSTSFIEGGEFQFSGTLISAPSITSIPDKVILLIKGGSGSGTVNIPLTRGRIEISQNTYTTLTLNAIAASVKISGNSLLTSVNLPNLTISQSLPNDSATLGSSINGNPNLTTVSFPQLIYFDNSFVAYPSFVLYGNGFSSATINSILQQLLTVGPVYGVDLRNQYPIAAPTGQGIIDKQTLISQGKNILTD